MQCNVCTKAIHLSAPEHDRCRCEVPDTGLKSLHPLTRPVNQYLHFSAQVLPDYHTLWDELHTEVRTKQQFEAWVTKVPQFGCSCASWLKDYVRDNPPTDDLREYGWRLHNAVNAKLAKTFFTWSEFEQKYPNTT